jgi:hypothetical protein
MKRFAALLVLIMALVSMPRMVSALDLDTVVGFSGQGSPSGKFYYPINEGMDLVFGFSAEVPGQKYRDEQGRQVNPDLLIGLNSEMPVVGAVDMYFTFDDEDGVVRTGKNEGSDWMITKFTVSKKWLYALNDRINLGVSMILGEVLLEGSKQVNVMTEIQPVMGVTISI